MALASSNSQPSLSMSANVDSIIPQKAHILTMTRWSDATFLDVMPAILRANCIPPDVYGVRTLHPRLGYPALALHGTPAWKASLVLRSYPRARSCL